MYKGKKILCLIPARGGSKGLPGKNIKELNGKPLISYSIEKALKLPEIDRVVVSTDDKAIAETAIKYGAEVPFLREAGLARSTTPIIPVIMDAVSRLKSQGASYDYALVLQANSPLTLPEDITRALHKVIDEKLDVVFTVSEIPHPPQWALKITGSTPQFAFADDTVKIGHSRQQEEVLFRSTGAAYIVKLDYLFKNTATARVCLPAAGQRTGVVMTDCYSSVDIDTELDFHLADTISKLKAERR